MRQLHNKVNVQSILLAAALISVRIQSISGYIVGGTPAVVTRKLNSLSSFEPCRAKMVEEGITPSAISAFESCYNSLVSGNNGMIPESTISPVHDLFDTNSIVSEPNPELLSQTVVLKLNGGLGTSMGLDKAKSLLEVKGGNTFLDLMAKQVIRTREECGEHVKFVLMNSYSTSDDTMAFLRTKYPDLAAEEGLELLQNKVPKLDAETYEPTVCELNPSNEWCPPGHGDLYAALVGSGRLSELLQQGYQYMFVSNSDNLGATLDQDILTHFAATESPFMLECCRRTENDKKGGHLAIRNSDQRLILRESANCADDDEDAFQDITRHRFFNTNNLWIRLDKLQEKVDEFGGIIPLPIIKNSKTVDPKDGSSQKVVQLETAMGSAVECFDGASAVVVPRTRFAPVKKCNDLLLLRSDAYSITEDFCPILHPACEGVAPVITLDSKNYKLVEALEEAIPEGVPSLAHCRLLIIEGAFRMSRNTRFVGDVVLMNTTEEAHIVRGIIEDAKLDVAFEERLGRHSLPAFVKAAPISMSHAGSYGLR